MGASQACRFMRKCLQLLTLSNEGRSSRLGRDAVRPGGVFFAEPEAQE